MGFVVRGLSGKSLLLRAVGPTLGSFGIAGALADAFASAGAFPLPTTSKDATVLTTLAAAGYSARITSNIAGDSGIALAEFYDRDADDATSRLANVSTLGFAGLGAQALVPGFVIGGTAPKLLLIRAVGPGLAPFGVEGALADPQIAIVPLGQNFTVTRNDNWSATGADQIALVAAFQSAGAFALPASSKDAALVVRLPPGGYTVIVTGADDSAGRALVEIYDLDP